MFNLHDILRFCEVLASLSIHLQSRITIEVWINIVDNRLFLLGYVCLSLCENWLMGRWKGLRGLWINLPSYLPLIIWRWANRGPHHIECFICMPLVQAMTTSSNNPSWSVVYWLLPGIGRVIIHYLRPRVPFQKRVSRRLLGVWRDIYVIYDVLSGLRW